MMNKANKPWSINPRSTLPSEISEKKSTKIKKAELQEGASARAMEANLITLNRVQQIYTL
jgi:hypothetical protein